MKKKPDVQLNAYEKLYRKQLTTDEVEEIKHNFYGFLNLLIEIDKEQEEKRND